VDLLIGKLCCCCCGKSDLEGRTQSLMLSFSFLQNYSKAQTVVKEVVKYLRFKIASNTMLWPLTTLGYNATCPNHLFTRMPGLVMYYVLVASAAMDLSYLLVLYLIAARKPGLKDCRILFLPFLGSTVCALLGAIVVLVKSNWSVIFGFNWDLSWSFEMSFGFGMFQVFNWLLSCMEIVSLVVKIGKAVAGVADEPVADKCVPENAA